MTKLLHTVSSAFRIFPDTADDEILSASMKRATMLRNDTFSFQILFRSPQKQHWTPLSVSVTCDGLTLAVYRVGYVGVGEVANDHQQAGFERNTPGLFPSPLYPRNPGNKITAAGAFGLYVEPGEDCHLCANGSFSALWVTVNPDGEELSPGEKQIDISLTNLKNGTLLETESFRLEVFDKSLCDESIYYTNWFHVDCLCDHYGVEPYSPVFYRYFETFLRNMVRHRQNTILLPAITPALDTVVGWKRKNVQLVDIEKTSNGYRFGFEELEKYIHVCRRWGIRYFEHPPLFSQWGAKSAVTIYDTSGAQLFGWETSAVDPAYTHFLTCYLRELFAFEEKTGCRFLFHISDEPTQENLDSYRKAADSVRPLLSSHTVIDALDDVSFFKQGIVQTPVAFIASAESFIGQCDDFWMYYTCGMHQKEIASRLITVTASRARVLGLQLWYYGAKGFLHWGYNYCYDYMSSGIFDPLANPCGYKNYPGASFLAYYTPKGAIPSIGEKLMGEAMDDVRALKTLESAIGREAVIALCEKILGKPISNTLVPDKQDMVTLRLAINEEIKRTECDKK